MRRSTLEQVRLPLALGLLLVAVFVVVVSGNDEDDLSADPSPSVVVGEPGGGVVEVTPSPVLGGASPTVSPPAPEPTEAATPVPTPAPTPQPDGFTAQIHACRSLSGATCVDELNDIGQVDVFTALLRFTDSNTGDTMNAVLIGPSGTIEGGAYTLPSGGDGYYYAMFSTGGLEPGEYTLIGTRNGTEVASTRVQRSGG